MLFDENLLLSSGALLEEYVSKELIYAQGDRPLHYFQIVSGTVELVNYHEEGKEFTLDILSCGQSLGESMLFSARNYQINAVAKTACKVLKLRKEIFMRLILESEDLTVKFFESLCDNIFYNSSRLFSNSSIAPATKIAGLMDYHKENSVKDRDFEIPFTRQQIANLTGLRVETVIRTVKQMEKDDIVRLRGHQIYY